MTQRALAVLAAESHPGLDHRREHQNPDRLAASCRAPPTWLSKLVSAALTSASISAAEAASLRAGAATIASIAIRIIGSARNVLISQTSTPSRRKESKGTERAFGPGTPKANQRSGCWQLFQWLTLGFRGKAGVLILLSLSRTTPNA